MNSLMICKNILYRLSKETNIIILFILCPLLAAFVTGFMTQPTEAISLGIASELSSDQTLIDVLAAKNYNLIPLPSIELTEMIEEKQILLAIRPSAKSGLSYDLITSQMNDSALQLCELLNQYATGQIALKDLNIDASYSNEHNDQAQRALSIFLMLVMIFVGNSTLSLHEDRRKRTFMRLHMMPLKKWEVAAGYTLAYTAIGMAQIVLFLAITSFVMHLDWLIPMPALLLILMCYCLCCVGIAIGLAAFVKEIDKYSFVLAILAIFSSFLSGTLIPTELLGNILAKITPIMPQYWVLEAYLNMIKTPHISVLSYPLFILLLFAAIFFSFGIKVLKPSSI